MADGKVLYEVRDKVSYVTINDYERHNSLNRAVCEELHEVWIAFEKDRQARVAIITGTRNVFCTGMDLEEVSQGPSSTPDLNRLVNAMPNEGMAITKTDHRSHKRLGDRCWPRFMCMCRPQGGVGKSKV